MIHLFGQVCRECGEPVQPGDVYCSVKGLDPKEIDFVYRACCAQCRETQ